MRTMIPGEQLTEHSSSALELNFLDVIGMSSSHLYRIGHQLISDRYCSHSLGALSS